MLLSSHEFILACSCAVLVINSGLCSEQGPVSHMLHLGITWAVNSQIFFTVYFSLFYGCNILVHLERDRAEERMFQEVSAVPWDCRVHSFGESYSSFFQRKNKFQGGVTGKTFMLQTSTV